MADSMRQRKKNIFEINNLGEINLVYGFERTFAAIRSRPTEIAETLSLRMRSSLRKMLE